MIGSTFLDPSWQQALISLEQGNSVLIHAPKYYGKNFFYNYLLRDERINSSFQLINIKLATNKTTLAFQVIWDSIIDQIEGSTYTRITNKYEFIREVINLIQSRRLLFVLKANNDNSKSNAALIDVFQQILLKRPRKFLQNVIVLVLDDYSLYYLELKLSTNSSRWDFFQRFLLRQYDSLERLSDILFNITGDFDLNTRLSNFFMEVTGGHQGLLLEAINFLKQNGSIKNIDHFEKTCLEHLAGCSVTQSLQRKMLTMAPEVWETMMNFRERKLFEDYSDICVTKLHQLGILLENRSSYSVLCPGIITESLMTAMNAKNINSSTHKHLKMQEHYEHGYALFIGIRYGFTLRPLEGALRDVNDLYNHFTHLHKASFKPDNILLLTETDATKDKIENGLNVLSEKINSDAESSVLIYYSGHGGSQDGKFFLIPYDFEENNYIFSEDFARNVAAIKAKKCLIILDCCHAENIPVHEKNVSTNFLSGFIEDLNSILPSPTTKGDFSQTIKKGSGKVILTSCQSNETSLDIGSNGLFTQVLLECLNGKDNIEKDGWVRLIDMMRYIPSNVSARAKKFGHMQNPVFKRIENISSEEYIVCAYDMAHTSEFAIEKKPEAISISNPTSIILELIDQNDFVSVFESLDKLKIKNRFQYNRLKREYYAGLTRIELMDFSDRLKIFITSSI